MDTVWLHDPLLAVRIRGSVPEFPWMRRLRLITGNKLSQVTLLVVKRIARIHFHACDPAVAMDGLPRT